MTESECFTSLRPNTKENAKTTKSKGRVYTTPNMSSHRYSQHELLHKRKWGKESRLLLPSGQWVQNKEANKNECPKGRKKGENGEIGVK